MTLFHGSHYSMQQLQNFKLIFFKSWYEILFSFLYRTFQNESYYLGENEHRLHTYYNLTGNCFSFIFYLVFLMILPSQKSRYGVPFLLLRLQTHIRKQKSDRYDIDPFLFIYCLSVSWKWYFLLTQEASFRIPAKVIKRAYLSRLSWLSLAFFEVSATEQRK